jgi:hypothetical protein
MLNERRERSSQISILREGDRTLMYCCHTLRTEDMARNPHVLSVGIDLVPALRSNGLQADEVVNAVAEACLRNHGQAAIPEFAANAIKTVARVLNIAWLEDALVNPASIICPRSTNCPRTERCAGNPSHAREIADVKQEIIGKPRVAR